MRITLAKQDDCRGRFKVGKVLTELRLHHFDNGYGNKGWYVDNAKNHIVADGSSRAEVVDAVKAILLAGVIASQANA